ncbi:DUF47 family protein [bacterium]|nr:DUF47 family protein [bacterium]
MGETRNILGWLGMAEEQSVMRDAEDHIRETCHTVQALYEAAQAFVSGDSQGKLKSIEAVRKSERAADALVWKMINKLSEGLLLPPDREDLLRFAKALDAIADSTNRAARLLSFIEKGLPETVEKTILINTELIVKASRKLREAIRAASKNHVKEALANCEEVERCEHEADDQKIHLINAIIHAKLTAPDLLISYNLAESLEEITDRIDQASDLVKLVVVQSK